VNATMLRSALVVALPTQTPRFPRSHNAQANANVLVSCGALKLN
jgi:hypothetical protein